MSLFKKLGLKIGIGKVVDFTEEKGWSDEKERSRFKDFLSGFLSVLFGLETGTKRRPDDDVEIRSKKDRPKKKVRVLRRRTPFRK